MARLHEYKGKELLREAGVATPQSAVARTPEEAGDIARQLGGKVVLKVQAWTTGRAAQGGVQFASTLEEATQHATAMFELRFGNFPVDEILVERAIDIAHEVFVSLTIDDAAQAPLLLIDCSGGSGIEGRAARVARIPIDLTSGVPEGDLLGVLRPSAIAEQHHQPLVDAIGCIVNLARQIEARSFEVNPLVITADGEPADIVAADCRVTIDDYAVFRHPELGVEIARELDHPPTDLERVAYAVEEADHRGTFYFAVLPTEGHESTKGLIGFHGAGGGGSMMSMDAASSAGFTLANFCDTSGNPSAAKVYRAARIILSQPGLVGYFGSGSGVASQEQFWSAYGLAKAFNEVELQIPAVIRLGGNGEDRAVQILEDACRELRAQVEGYRKDDSPAFCAERFASLVESSQARSNAPAPVIPTFVGSSDAYSFPITGGRVWINHPACDATSARMAVDQAAGLLKLDEASRPVLAVAEEEVAGKDSEFIACEVECRLAGHPVVFVALGIEGLEEVA